MFTLQPNRAKICHVSLNQSAMDFLGNRNRIIESIKYAREHGCIYRAGAELEVPGYSCDDHFKEIDLFNHCWDTVAEILKQGLSNGLVIDLGMPILHRCIAYNVKIILYNGKIVLIRPKMHLADEGNYREKRFFVPYVPQANYALEKYYLPEYIKALTGQDFCDMGYANLRFQDALVGLEICEEVWRSNSISRSSHLTCDLIICSNGSHFQKGKLGIRCNLVKEVIQKCNVSYIYCNALGFDGAAYYFDGSNIAMNDSGILQIGEPSTMREMDLNCLVIDLIEQRESRVGDNSVMDESARGIRVPDVFIDTKFCQSSDKVTPIIKNYQFDCPQKQILQAASSYLWDYIRKSGASGIFLALSGGADSGITALIVHFMSERLLGYFQAGANDVIGHLRKVVGDPNFSPKTPQEISKKLFFTCYMGSKNSSDETRKRAKQLAEKIGCDHGEVEIDGIVGEFEALLKKVYDVKLRFQTDGGSWGEDIALQNIYARVRMVLSYLLAQLIPIRTTNNGYYLVLAAGNLDETLTGYYTKYDCSSGDLNLIGSLSKIDIKETLLHLHSQLGWEVIKDIAEARATADLKPSAVAQSDEEEIGLSFKEIDVFADLRINKNASIVNFYKEAQKIFWEYSAEELMNKISIFFTRYSRNRHKVEVLTTSLHLTNKSSSGKRFDLRPMIYEDQYRYELGILKNLIVGAKEQAAQDQITEK